MKKAALAITILALGTTWLSAQEKTGIDQFPTVTLSIREIAQQARSRNLDIFKAVRSVERARQDLLGEPELMDSSVSVGGGYTSGGAVAGGWYGQSNLSLPLFPQLSLGGGLSVAEGSQLEEQLSLSVKPLVPKRLTYAEEKTLNIALVRERYLKQRIYLDAERAALNVLVRDLERELARSTEALEQIKYELAQRRQELGEASFQDIQDQLVDLIDARQSLFDSEQRYLSDWRTLQLLFAPAEERIGVAPLSLDELLDLVLVRKMEQERFRDIPPVTERLENLRFELTALQAELKATPSWRPDVNLSAAVAFPGITPSVSLSFSFSPNQLKSDERQELAEDIEVNRMDIAAETYAAELQKTLGGQSVAIAEEALLSTQIQRDRDRVALQEAELLYQQGRRTTLELEQLRLNLRRTEILTFQAAAEVYRVSGENLMLFVSD